MSATWSPTFMPEKLNGSALEHLLPALVGLNENFLKTHQQTPLLYSSGVRYMAEPRGQEKWLTIPFVLKQRFGDCEDLSAWRAAELRVRGENAKCVWTYRKTPRGNLYHIRVQRGNGMIEDPSLLLGMPVKRKRVNQ